MMLEELSTEMDFDEPKLRSRAARTPRTKQRLQVLGQKLEAAAISDPAAASSPDAVQTSFREVIGELNQTECISCSSAFSIMNRRHHCRDCLAACCNSCSQARRAVPGMDGLQRVCSACEKLAPAPAGADLVTIIKQMNTTTAAEELETAPSSPCEQSSADALQPQPTLFWGDDSSLPTSSQQQSPRSKAAQAAIEAAAAGVQAAAPAEPRAAIGFLNALAAVAAAPRTRRYGIEHIAAIYAPDTLPATHVVEGEEFDALYRVNGGVVAEACQGCIGSCGECAPEGEQQGDAVASEIEEVVQVQVEVSWTVTAVVVQLAIFVPLMAAMTCMVLTFDVGM
ncbi:hypothetical protein JKP88DRAFT_245653 [Tribonema minus]|uniref:FYVE-type domain-containing protein n=1 Tax=Tribonema minus TaxID=303371 RepID=A0A836CFQ9_9STRA|nr:hypothetical protein JKP88DRAFT_245653 [Tribonema minus]